MKSPDRQLEVVCGRPGNGISSQKIVRLVCSDQCLKKVSSIPQPFKTECMYKQDYEFLKHRYIAQADSGT